MIRQTSLGDGIGILVSGLCMAHCLLLPLAVSSLSVWGIEFLTGEATHQVLVFVLLAVGLLAFIPGYQCHGKFSVVLLAVSALLTLSFAAFVSGDLWGEGAETWLTVLGSSTLVIAHLKNLSFCRACPLCVTSPLRAR